MRLSDSPDNGTSIGTGRVPQLPAVGRLVTALVIR
jgi:hypothetical protein